MAISTEGYTPYFVSPGEYEYIDTDRWRKKDCETIKLFDKNIPILAKTIWQTFSTNSLRKALKNYAQTQEILQRGANSISGYKTIISPQLLKDIESGKIGGQFSSARNMVIWIKRI